MPKMTPGYAKNTIRRALRAVVDPEPNDQEITKLWDYFGSACAYCDQKLNPFSREGHIDHLVSRGTNHISNRILSCGSCNGDKKRDKEWLEFLRAVEPNPTTFRKRRTKIQSWCRSNQPAKKYTPHPLLEWEINRVVLSFDIATDRLRRLRMRLAGRAKMKAMSPHVSPRALSSP